MPATRRSPKIRRPMTRTSPTHARLIIRIGTITLLAALALLAQAQRAKPDFALVNNNGFTGNDLYLSNRPTQAGVRPCARENLTIKEGEGDQAMGGRISTPFVLTNVSSSACTLKGYADLELLN